MSREKLRNYQSLRLAADDSRSRFYLPALAVMLGLVAWTGYRGGQLAHGEEHLTEHMPMLLRGWLGLPPAAARAHRDTTGAGGSSFYAARIAPIFEAHCLVCHGPNKHKARLRLDSYAGALRGGKDGPVIKAGDLAASELFRRITLPSGSKDAMPADGKPPLTADEVQLVRLWIAAGASAILGADAIAGAPAPRLPAAPLAPDYRPQRSLIAALEAELGLRLVPRSQNPTDGLILRTVSFPERCDDATLARLAPVAPLIVEAELARTRVTDAGLKSLTAFVNLRSLDLSYTMVTAMGVRSLASLARLEALNLSGTAVGARSLGALRSSRTLKRLYLFESGGLAAQPAPNG